MSGDGSKQRRASATACKATAFGLVLLHFHNPFPHRAANQGRCMTDRRRPMSRGSLPLIWPERLPFAWACPLQPLSTSKATPYRAKAAPFVSGQKHREAPMSIEPIFGHYPMTVAELNAWAIHQAGKLTKAEADRATYRLDTSRIVIRKV